MWEKIKALDTKIDEIVDKKSLPLHDVRVLSNISSLLKLNTMDKNSRPIIFIESNVKKTLESVGFSVIEKNGSYRINL